MLMYHNFKVTRATNSKIDTFKRLFYIDNSTRCCAVWGHHFSFILLRLGPSNLQFPFISSLKIASLRCCFGSEVKYVVRCL